MLGRLLAFDPSNRIAVEEALAHKYLTAYYDPSDEPIAERPFTFEMEFDELPTRQLKEMIYREAVDFKISQLTETSLWKSKENNFYMRCPPHAAADTERPFNTEPYIRTQTAALRQAKFYLLQQASAATLQ